MAFRRVPFAALALLGFSLAANSHGEPRRSEKVLQARSTSTRASANRSSDPTILAVDGLVLGIKKGQVWVDPTKALDGKSYRFASAGLAGAGKTIQTQVEFSDGPPAPSVDLKGVDPTSPETLYVSGGRAKFLNLRTISPQNSTYLSIARQFVLSKPKAKQTAKLLGGITADLNGDGTLETILVIDSGATAATKSKTDFNAVILRTLVGGKVKTIELEYETDYGQMRGPFSSHVVAAGDFDGDGKVEFVISTRDPWGIMYSLYQLGKDGHLQKLRSAGSGE